MLYAVLCAALLFVIAIYFLRPRKIIRLSKLRGHRFDVPIFQKLNREVRIFNKLKMIMPARRGIPTLYTDWLAKLHLDPRRLTKTADGIEKLMYICAAATLYANSRNEFVRRQLYKNILYVFGTSKKIARSHNFWTIPLSMKGVALAKRVTGYVIKQPIFKFLPGDKTSKFIPRESSLRFSDSYVIKNENETIIKHYTDKTIPAECHDIRGPYRFTHNFAVDKMKCTISHTADTFFCTCAGRTTAILVMVQGSTRHVNFETSIAEKTPDMNVYINLKTGGKVFTIHTDSKSAASAIIAQIKARRGNLDYLLTSEETDRTREIEDLYARAYLARFVHGENLRVRYTHARRHVPTLHLPTLVYDIADPCEMFDILDRFDRYRAIARACQSLNVVVLYSSQNDLVREYIAAFTNRHDARTLVQSGVFLFFIDKIKASNEVVYYFSKMAEVQTTPPSASAPLQGGELIVGCFQKPVLDKNKKLIPLLGGVAPRSGDGVVLISRKSVSYCLTDLATGISRYHKMPPNHQILDEFGYPIERGYDAVCRGIYIAVAPEKKSTRAAKSLAKSLTHVKNQCNNRITSGPSGPRV